MAFEWMLLNGAKDSIAPTITQRVIAFATDMKRMQAFAISNAGQKLKFPVDKVMHIADDGGKRAAIGPGETLLPLVPAKGTRSPHSRGSMKLPEATFRLLSSLAYPTLLEHQARASIR
ncbi:hypothetical protein JOM56_007050 [Amanita muscaria]